MLSAEPKRRCFMSSRLPAASSRSRRVVMKSGEMAPGNNAMLRTASRYLRLFVRRGTGSALTRRIRSARLYAERTCHWAAFGGTLRSPSLRCTNISPPNDIRRRKTFLCPKCGGAFTRRGGYEAVTALKAPTGTRLAVPYFRPGHDPDVMIRHTKRRTCRLTSKSSVIHNPTLDAASTPAETSTHSNSELHSDESSERSWSPPHLLPPLPPANVGVEGSGSATYPVSLETPPPLFLEPDPTHFSAEDFPFLRTWLP
ncbi:hypothetical protein M427DRAFT_140497 [Gonapodya prolifera JEL478]|uniref:Uncharacterized protein n=1 Tax=Gonapodya prolifera (strain JEL478) TaxID=1344416 RepID=A0A138ZZ55_GONPJ|nr:hypothetical protein M427DRAFT_140497 [Gonapodya prolifera JEL478]|eukprot:KXS09698.1 hypothetical protein M427DRAFT_140497 [Gonapodya prolifera JEL478]